MCLHWVEMSEAEKSLNFAHKDWDYDTRNLNRDDEDLQLIIDKKLKKLAHNKSAVEALNALKAEIKAQRQRYNDMRELWNSEDLDEKRTLCKVNDFIKGVLQTNAQDITISANMIKNHKTKHTEISAFEYSIIPFMLDERAILGIFRDLDGKADEISIISSRLNIQYRLVLADKGEAMSVASLVSNERSKKDIFAQLKRNKGKIWIKSDAR